MITDHSNMSENVDSDFKHNRNEKKKIYAGIKEKSIKNFFFFVFDRVRTCDLMVLIEICTLRLPH